MAWRYFGNKHYHTVDGDRYAEGDMIFRHEDALKLRDRMRAKGYLVRVIKKSMTGEPFWLVYVWKAGEKI